MIGILCYLLFSLALFLATASLYIGLVFDFLLNVVVMTVVFLELPKEFLVTERIKRHKQGPVLSWRWLIAIWFCINFLTPFDNKHCE